MKQPWIKSSVFDLALILAPGILPVLLVLIFPNFFENQAEEISPFLWVMLILLVDVAHVHSSLYRTYFNPTAIKEHTTVFKMTPILAWIVGVVLYSVSSILFWRCLAYLAVFHFIRQQYGFVRIYSRKSDDVKWIKQLQGVAIYLLTFIPICIWHFSGPKNFNWFVQGDFLYWGNPTLVLVLKVLFFITVAVYCFSELYLYVKCKTVNLPRILLVLGTGASWYVGIVLYNGDLCFTMLNVVSHGIPYMALVWASERNKVSASGSKFLKQVFSSYGVLIFLGIVFLFAYLEEGLWDALVWREHKPLFTVFYALSQVESQQLLAFLVPFLALPQIVHYVLDGFIWKIKKQAIL